MLGSKMTTMMMTTYSVILTLLLSTHLSAACFIRNCPPGGKRSLDIVSRAIVPCLSCGPDNSGQCIGPDICCGSFGCHMNTEYSRVCMKENERRQPCELTGEPCGTRGQGRCVADSLCCHSTACSFNEKCARYEGSGVGSPLISLLNRILDVGDLE